MDEIHNGGNTPMPGVPNRGTEWAEMTRRGIRFLCDCGAETEVEIADPCTITDGWEFAATCSGCGGSHPFNVWFVRLEDAPDDGLYHTCSESDGTCSVCDGPTDPGRSLCGCGHLVALHDAVDGLCAYGSCSCAHPGRNGAPDGLA